jgi:16S rRNA processing protein RimM
MSKLHQFEADWPTDAVEVGVITGAWGVRGGLRIKPHSADPQALFSSKRWFLAVPRPRGPVDPAQPLLPERLMLRVVTAKAHGDAVVATVHDLESRNDAEALKGARVHVPRSSFPSADTDEYYWVDLIGLSVLNRDGVQLGEVIDLMQTGPHSVLRIRPAGAEPAAAEAAEVLIPFVAAYVDAVDLPNRQIRVDWADADE